MGKNINILIDDALHYSLKLIAAKTGQTLKSVIVLTLERMVKDIEEKERKG